MRIDYKKTGWFILIAGLIFLSILWLQSGREEEAAVSADPANSPYRQGDMKAVTAENLVFSGDEFFAEYRLERERVRGRQSEMLREVLHSQAMKEAQPQAALQLINMSAVMEKELQAEGMIKAQGFSDCVAIIQAETALIVLGSDRPLQAQQDEIMATVEKITGYDAEQICIIYREK